MDGPQGQAGPADGPAVVLAEDGDVGVAPGLGVLAAVTGLDDGHAVVEVEVGDPPCPTLVEVDGAGVDEAEGAAVVDGPDQPAVGLHDLELVAAAAAKPHAVGGPAVTGPHRDRLAGGGSGGGAVEGAHEQPVVEDEGADAVVEQARPPALVVAAQRQLVGGARQVGEQHVGVGRVDDGGLGRAVEHLGGVGHEPLVELVVAGDQHGQRRARVPTGPTGLLPHRRDGAREAVEDAGVEATDVDAQFEGGGGDHPQEASFEELGLDVAPLGRQVAAAVGANELAVDGGSRRRMSAATISVPFRLWQNTMVRWPRRTSSAARAPVVRPLRGIWSAAVPVGSSTVPSGPGGSARRGFQRATMRSPRGEASSVTSCTSSPHSSEASRAGSPMVADENTNVGSEP